MSTASKLINALLVSTLLVGSALAWGGQQACSEGTWRYPPDEGLVKRKSKPAPYHADGFPEGVTIVRVVYKSPGLLVRRPCSENGAWQFDGVGRLYYHNKLFALIGTAEGVWVDANGHRGGLGYVTTLVIYDRDGGGNLDTVTDLPQPGDGNKLEIPAWVRREDGQ